MSLLDLICPARCEGCGAAGGVVCPDCRRPLSASARPHRPTPCPEGLPPLWVVAHYEGATRGLLLGYKERGTVGLAATLAVPLAAAVNAALAGRGGRLLLVPVPSSRAATRSRGDDVVELLARKAVRHLRAPDRDLRLARMLVHRRVVADSAGLSASGRAANLSNALGIRAGRSARLTGAAVVIVDDLVTTGTTLSEAARALRAAGADVIGAAAVAATARHNQYLSATSGR